jgi:hypothetical protein
VNKGICDWRFVIGDLADQVMGRTVRKIMCDLERREVIVSGRTDQARGFLGHWGFLDPIS